MTINGKDKRNFRALGSFATMLCISAVAVFQLLFSDGLQLYLGILILSVIAWPWFSIIHSAGHNAYFTNKSLNSVVGHIASIFTMVPFFLWKFHHQEHHKWTGFADKDPTAIDFELPAKEDLKFLNFLWKSWLPVLTVTHVFTHLWNIKSINSLQLKEKNINPKLYFSIIFILITYICLSIIQPWFLLYIGLSLIPFVFSSDIILLSQHAEMPMKISVSAQKPNPLSEHYKYTRSINFGNFINKYIFLNFNEHLAHHKRPTLPHFYLNQYVESNDPRRMNGIEWIRYIKKQHIRDVLKFRMEAK
jgi:omega-6 fatty acid desaturase (delta-12 desaturase)